MTPERRFSQVPGVPEKLPLLRASDIGPGREFPPERRRNLNIAWATYQRYKNGNFAGFSRSGNNRIETNIFSKIVLFWQDYVIPENIQILAIGNPRAQAFIDAMRDNLLMALREVIGDMVIHGVGVFDNSYPLQPRAINPMGWFPIREAWDHTIELGDVFAYPYRDGNTWYDDSIRITRFEGNTAIGRSYDLENRTIGKYKGDRVETQVPTDIAVPVTLDNSLYGRSMYTDIEGQVKELHIRESKISTAQDLQSLPHLAASNTALRKDPASGKYVIDTDGMVIPMTDTDRYPAYITWDASFEEQERTIQRIRDNIVMATDVSPVVFNTNIGRNSNVYIPSGSAVDSLSNNTNKRIDSFRQVLTPALERVIRAQAEGWGLNGGEIIDIPGVEVIWNIPLVQEGNNEQQE